MLMGIVGGGGGGIYVVILMFLLHQNAKTAALTALVLSTITLSGAAGQYLRKKQFRLDYVLAFSALDIAGTVTGAILLKFIEDSVLKIIILSVLLLSGLSSLIKIKSPKSDKEIKAIVKAIPLAAPVGLCSGLITGTTGLSASTMLSSFLIGLFDFSPLLAVGTTTIISFIGNLVSILLIFSGDMIFHTQPPHIDMETLLVLGIGSAVGAVLGSKLTAKINRKTLTILLAVMAVVPGIYLALKG